MKFAAVLFAGLLAVAHGQLSLEENLGGGMQGPDAFDCKGDTVYKPCGTACPRDCADKDSKFAMCIAMCVEGCQCPKRTQWLHKETQTCHESFETCPGN